MRFVQKPITNIAASLVSESASAHLVEICKSFGEIDARASIYRNTYTSEYGNTAHVIDQLNLSYHGKCAYCERVTDLEVEHFRPKGGVTGEQGRGYYWLCYEWSNLIPSCHTCNNNKRNKFAVDGVRVTLPVWLDASTICHDSLKAESAHFIAENALLLHPEIDTPTEFLSCCLDDSNEICLQGIDEQGRGQYTINCCKLNRYAVAISRKNMIQNELVDWFRKEVADYVEAPQGEVSLLRGLCQVIAMFDNNSRDDTKEHCLLRQFMCTNAHNFIAIVLPHVQSEQHYIVSHAAQIYLPPRHTS